MDIQKAKEEIKNTLAVYLQKDAEGNYRYPLVNQRPLLLMGPPGVGKTAIVEQAAREAGLPMVAYTMTTTPGKVPWVCRKSRSGTTAASIFPLRSIP